MDPGPDYIFFSTQSILMRHKNVPDPNHAPQHLYIDNLDPLKIARISTAGFKLVFLRDPDPNVPK